MFYLVLTSMLMLCPLAAMAQTSTESHQQHREIQATQLKSWYDQKKNMVVLDARSKPYFDGRLLPNAKWVTAESSEKEIQAAVPSKDSLVVVYCSNTHCPASGWLYDKLMSLGYTNVYEYHEGIDGWVSKGFPITKSNK